MQSEIHTVSGIVMGGPWQCRYVPVAGVPSDKVAAAALSALQRVDEQMSHYSEVSDLARLNRAPLGEFVPVPAEMLEVIRCADRLARATGGALNIALGRAVSRWGFGPEPVPEQRPQETISLEDAALAGMDSFTLRPEPPAILKCADIRFNLSAIAKGYAVDLAARAVARLGVRDFLIEAAGEIYARGKQAPGQPWSIGLELPVPGEERLVFDEIALDGMAAATSGGYRKRHVIDGKSVAHTIDPATGAPLEGELLSVTVLHEACMQADALATALYVLGPEAGPRFAETNAIAALFMIREPEGLKEIRSEAFMRATRG